MSAIRLDPIRRQVFRQQPLNFEAAIATRRIFLACLGFQQGVMADTKFYQEELLFENRCDAFRGEIFGECFLVFLKDHRFVFKTFLKTTGCGKVVIWKRCRKFPREANSIAFSIVMTSFIQGAEGFFVFKRYFFVDSGFTTGFFDGPILFRFHHCRYRGLLYIEVDEIAGRFRSIPSCRLRGTLMLGVEKTLRTGQTLVVSVRARRKCVEETDIEREILKICISWSKFSLVSELKVFVM